MPLRHWTGSVQQKAVAWKCPTCGAENLGPLEQGCVACHAGDPKQVNKGAAVPPVVLPENTGARLYGTPAPDPHAAAKDWSTEFALQVVDGRYSPQRIAEIAFLAGVEWIEKQQAAPAGNASNGVGGNERPEAATEGGWGIALIDPRSKGEEMDPAWELTEIVDPRAHATIVAALAFYLDNQLGYGAIPGQLTAAECRSLIEKLKEPEGAA